MPTYEQIDMVVANTSVRRILKRGGLFWKSEKCANNLDSNFHWSWISFRRFVRNLRRNVSESSEIQSFFLPKIRWSPKKKKGLRQNSEWFFGRNPKFKGFFCPKLGDLQKKKKKKDLYSRSVLFFTRTHSKGGPCLNFAHFTMPDAQLTKGAHFTIPEPDAQLTKGGGPCLNFAHFTMQFCNPSDPKGGAWPNGPPPKYAPGRKIICLALAVKMGR